MLIESSRGRRIVEGGYVGSAIDDDLRLDIGQNKDVAGDDGQTTADQDREPVCRGGAEADGPCRRGAEQCDDDNVDCIIEQGGGGGEADVPLAWPCK
jgi:hypothetical protein